jgi:hypothetical protein
MKNILLYISILLFSACKKNDTAVDNSPAQNTSYLITSFQTDNNYAATDESNYVVRNNKKHLNKLLLFMGGSYSAPKEYEVVCNHAATIGLDVISLSYPNSVAAFSLGSIAGQYNFDNFREEICFGTAVSNAVSVDVLNCITTRATSLLLFLKNTYPNENWGQYLTSANTLVWSKIIVAGHSQGAGHACYLGKKKLVDRVVMLSGPNDYSVYYNSPANWLLQNGQTPVTKQYSLLHTQDEIVPYTYQVANLKALGLLNANETPLLADNLAAPYSNAHSLSINTPATSYHSSTVGLHSILPSIWTYLFTTP